MPEFVRGWEFIVLILLVFVLFGAKRMPDAARGLGRSLRIFKAETKGLRDDDDDAKADDDNNKNKNTPAAPLEVTAGPQPVPVEPQPVPQPVIQPAEQSSDGTQR